MGASRLGDGDSSYRPVRGEFSMSTDEQQPASADRPATEVLSIAEVSAAKEIVISAHESAHCRGWDQRLDRLPCGNQQREVA